MGRRDGPGGTTNVAVERHGHGGHLAAAHANGVTLDEGRGIHSGIDAADRIVHNGPVLAYSVERLAHGRRKQWVRSLCATRGGEPSSRTQDAAIELAKELDDTLLFLYVADLEFLDKMAEAGVLNTERELSRVGQGRLLAATARAAGRGVAAETIVRTGDIREEVKDTARKEGVSSVVLGQPTGEESVFELVDLEAVAGEIEDEVGVEARII